MSLDATYNEWLKRMATSNRTPWQGEETMADNPAYPEPVNVPGPVDPHPSPQNPVPTPDLNAPPPDWPKAPTYPNAETTAPYNPSLPAGASWDTPKLQPDPTHELEPEPDPEVGPLDHLSDYEQKLARDWQAVIEYDEKIRGFNRGG